MIIREAKLRMFVVLRGEFDVVKKVVTRRKVKIIAWTGSKKSARVKRRKSSKKKKGESMFPVEKTRRRSRRLKTRLVRRDLSLGLGLPRRRRK